MPQLMAKLVAACKEHTPQSTSSPNVKSIMSSFMKKYVNARVGGYLKGEHQRYCEKKGQRTKGVTSLRDKMYVLGKLGGKSKQVS